MQLPLGSTRELGSHKGYSLGVMVDIICGQLSSAVGFDSASPTRRAHFVQAWDLAGFCDPDEFKADMDGMLKTLRETKPMPGEERVFYAGLPEAETEAERARDGIPLHREVIDWAFRAAINRPPRTSPDGSPAIMNMVVTDFRKGRQ